MNKKMIIMLEDEDTRYEFYMKGIERSNLDNTIVRWELRYNYIHNMGAGLTRTTDHMLHGISLEDEIARLLMEGYEIVTFETKKFF